MDALQISGKWYISSRRAAKEHNYHADYIGQLIRTGKVEGQKVGRSWYVETNSLAQYLGTEKNNPTQPESLDDTSKKKVSKSDTIESTPASLSDILEKGKNTEATQEDVKMVVPVPESPFSPPSEILELVKSEEVITEKDFRLPREIRLMKYIKDEEVEAEVSPSSPASHSSNFSRSEERPIVIRHYRESEVPIGEGPSAPRQEKASIKRSPPMRMSRRAVLLFIAIVVVVLTVAISISFSYTSIINL